MATTSYDPEKTYDIKVNKPIKVRSLTLKPLADASVTGKILNFIVEEYGADVIDVAVARS